MKLIIEWLDKDDNVLISKGSPTPLSFGDTVLMSPIIPEVKTVIELPGHAPMCSAVMEEAANRYLKESITAFRIRILEDTPDRKNSIASAGICECCVLHPVQYTLKDPGRTPAEYHVCANCLPALVNTALSPVQFFNLIRNGHTTKEHLLHGDFYDDETGEALQPKWSH